MLTRPPPSAPHGHHRAGAARCPGASFRRPQPLTCLVLEADVGAQVRRGGFTAGHTSCLPGGDRLLVALQRALHRHLHRPAVPVQQLADALDGVPEVEQPADQRLDPAQRPALVVGEPVRQRPPVQFGFQPRPLCGGQLLPRDRPLATAAPRCRPRCQAARQRPTVRSLTRRSRAMSRVDSPSSNRPAASSRNRSRRSCSAGVYPPLCPYRMTSVVHPERRTVTTLRLYEFILCSR